MKTATLDVGGMVSMLDYQAVERRLGKMPGVQRAMASIVARSVTVEYDEAVTSVARLRDEINECGFHCTGQIVPRHVCARAPTDHPADERHAAHACTGWSPRVARHGP